MDAIPGQITYTFPQRILLPILLMLNAKPWKWWTFAFIRREIAKFSLTYSPVVLTTKVCKPIYIYVCVWLYSVQCARILLPMRQRAMFNLAPYPAVGIVTHRWLRKVLSSSKIFHRILDCFPSKKRLNSLLWCLINSRNIIDDDNFGRKNA